EQLVPGCALARRGGGRGRAGRPRLSRVSPARHRAGARALRGDVAAGNFHPDVGGTLHDIDLAVSKLVHHTLGIVPDRVEALGDRLVAFTDLHAGDLLAHDLVEYRSLPERPSDDLDLVRLEIRDLLEQ